MVDFSPPPPTFALVTNFKTPLPQFVTFQNIFDEFSLISKIMIFETRRRFIRDWQVYKIGEFPRSFSRMPRSFSSSIDTYQPSGPSRPKDILQTFYCKLGTKALYLLNERVLLYSAEYTRSLKI